MSKPSLEARRTKRFIGRIEGTQKGPTVVFFGGVHGNESAGPIAIDYVLKELQGLSAEISGNIFGIHGDIPAQLMNQRFLDEDLNRMWTTERIKLIKGKSDDDLNTEERELIKMHEQISEILSTCSGPFYFVDLHTTSSKTIPFITINDALINRRFSRQFPVPVVLGIEEYLKGPLLSYINEKGYVSLGFEAGMHTDEDSVKNNISFIWLTLGFADVLNLKRGEWFDFHFDRLKKATQGKNHFYEVHYRHEIGEEEKFKMIKGFDSFDNVKRNTLLALHNNKEIRASSNTVLFMPLYQELGKDGFFLIRKIPIWALKASSFLRMIKFDAFLAMLPGISWSNDNKESLMVDLKVARFLAKALFHLLGYRNRTVDKTHILMRNRERTAKTDVYRNTGWYQKTV